MSNKSILTEAEAAIDKQMRDVDSGVKVTANKDGAKVEGDVALGKGWSVGGWIGYYGWSAVDWAARVVWKPRK